MSFLLKNLFIALIVSLVIGAGYYFIFGKSKIEMGTVDVNAVNIAKQQTEKILADTKRISDYSFDDNIFHDERFISLRDTRIDLGSSQTGRDNPFAPIQ